MAEETINALAENDDEKLCDDLVSADYREELDNGGPSVLPALDSCEGTMDAIARLRQEEWSDTEVDSLVVSEDGEQALFTVELFGSPGELVVEDGSWKLAELPSDPSQIPLSEAELRSMVD